ncbi:DUF6308 family protein [Streptomyces sp. NPDC093261]|uniref:DUF6308 family protein n=1 Tax=Streptomyces sp. NPDC093261 TaxID=3366037 RepID=UPI0038036229
MPDQPFRAALRAALRAGNGALCDQLIRLRHKAGIGEDIILRVFDAIAWMRQGQRRQTSAS